MTDKQINKIKNQINIEIDKLAKKFFTDTFELKQGMCFEAYIQDAIYVVKKNLPKTLQQKFDYLVTRTSETTPESHLINELMKCV